MNCYRNGVTEFSPQTAAWLRDIINEGQFHYAISLAAFLREDLNDIVLPPPYEIYPQLFVSSDIIQKAYETKMKGKNILTSEKQNLIFLTKSHANIHIRREKVINYPRKSFISRHF